MSESRIPEMFVRLYEGIQGIKEVQKDTLDIGRDGDKLFESQKLIREANLDAVFRGVFAEVREIVVQRLPADLWGDAERSLRLVFDAVEKLLAWKMPMLTRFQFRENDDGPLLTTRADNIEHDDARNKYHIICRELDETWRGIEWIMPYTSEYIEVGDSGAVKPGWNPETRVLSFCEWSKRYSKNPARQQITVITAFNEEGWPKAIDDPLDSGKLSDTLRGLKDSLGQEAPIEFYAVGDGERIGWRKTLR